MAETQHNIGISRGDMGDYAGALAAAEEAARLAERVKDEGLSALALFGRGALHLSQGDTDLAAAELTRAQAVYERLQQPVGLAEVWRLQAGVARARGDLAGAGALRSEEHTSELPSPCKILCPLLVEKKKKENLMN